jgi:hypothetical protein
MLTAVELHGEPRAGAVEVDDVGAARMLPTELETGEAFGAEVKPEGGFGVGAVAAQGAATGETDIHAGLFGVI